MEIGKEFIEKVTELAALQIVENNGHTLIVRSTGEVEDATQMPFTTPTLAVHSLDALVRMVRTEGPRWKSDILYISAHSPDTVSCFTQFRGADGLYQRSQAYQAQATDVPGWDSKVTLSFEEAMIALRTRFQPTTDAEYALKLLSDITTGSKITFNDNGIATSVVTKRGVDLQSNSAIRPIITLRPYRTFQELEQPASQFLIRVSERGITFVEADGGMWRLEARKSIVQYLSNELEPEVSAGTVVVML